MPGPRAVKNLQMPHPRDWQGGQMPRRSPGGGELGAGGVDWCIKLILSLKSHMNVPLFNKLTDLWITILSFDLNYKFINGSFAFSPGQIYILGSLSPGKD